MALGFGKIIPSFQYTNSFRNPKSGINASISKKKTFWTLIINVIFREFNKRLKAILQRHQSFFIKSGVPFKLLSILLPYFPSNLSLPYHYHIGFLTGRKESDFKKKITETWLNLVTKKRGRRD